MYWKQSRAYCSAHGFHCETLYANDVFYSESKGVFSVAMKQFNGSSSSNKKKKCFSTKEGGNVELLFLFYNRRMLENLYEDFV